MKREIPSFAIGTVELSSVQNNNILEVPVKPQLAESLRRQGEHNPYLALVLLLMSTLWSFMNVNALGFRRKGPGLSGSSEFWIFYIISVP